MNIQFSGLVDNVSLRIRDLSKCLENPLPSLFPDFQSNTEPCNNASKIFDNAYSPRTIEFATPLAGAVIFLATFCKTKNCSAQL